MVGDGGGTGVKIGEMERVAKYLDVDLVALDMQFADRGERLPGREIFKICRCEHVFEYSREVPINKG